MVRTANAPAGDYAEWLVARATDGQLEPNSRRSWDLVTKDGDRMQVKARVTSDITKRGERQLSSFRSWDFDAALIVLFDDQLKVRRAAWFTVTEIESAARADPYVNALRVIATDSFMKRGADWTERLRETASRQDD
ncbi:MAG TPA: hypothetical protein VIY71_00470 [Solirubrobacterales bacterium]